MTTDARPPDPPGYYLGDCLGRGTVGPVYRGSQVSTGQPVAVKVLEDASMGGRAQLESTLDGLQHPHLVPMLDADLTAVPPYLVMSLMQGSFATYREQMKRGEVIPERLLLSWLKQLGSALEYLHARGSVHCRLQPRNILLDLEGGARLADAGQGVALAGGLGTWFCMPPEQLESGVPVPGWDVYGLGACFYFLLSGSYPRDHGFSPDPTTYAEVIRRTPLVPVRRHARYLSPRLARALDGCLHHDPTRRFGSIPELLRALRPKSTTGALAWRWAREPAQRGSWRPSWHVARHVVRELGGPALVLGFLLLLLPLAARSSLEVAQVILLLGFLTSRSRLLPRKRGWWALGLAALAFARNLL